MSILWVIFCFIVSITDRDSHCLHSGRVKLSVTPLQKILSGKPPGLLTWRLAAGGVDGTYIIEDMPRLKLGLWCEYRDAGFCSI